MHYSEIVQQSGNKHNALIKQLIVAATFLLIQNRPKTIYCIRVILDFTILTQYLLYENKTFFYIEYALYKLDKTKITFENHYSIYIKLFRPTLNYLKFHTITHFVKCIYNYKDMINYDMTHTEVTHKYLFKTFY